MLKNKIRLTEEKITRSRPADTVSGKMRHLVWERRQSSAATVTAATLAFRACQLCLHARETGQTHLIQRKRGKTAEKHGVKTSRSVRGPQSTSAKSYLRCCELTVL